MYGSLLGNGFFSFYAAPCTLLEIFSDDNMFVEENPNNTSVSTHNVANELAAVTSESEVSVAFEPGITEVGRQLLSVMKNTYMYSASEIQPSSLKNAHLVINPTISNLALHFHFHGQP